MSYDVYFGSSLIGLLEIENGKYKYTVNIEGIEKVSPLALPVVVLLTGTDGFVDPIPFFKVRIDNALRFGSADRIESHTDSFKMFKRAV